MDVHGWGQHDHAVRFDWGPTGAARTATPGCLLVVVDVLSFTTTVSVAVERGMLVHPAPWRSGRADDLATRAGAELAVARTATSSSRPWSLSPAGMRAAPFTARVVLPSPNGASIAAAADGVTVVAACLRNAARVGEWLRAATPERPVTVVAAGERWPDGSLRPALEDVLGAGAVLSSLARGPGSPAFSPEAEAARALYEATPSPAAAVRRCASGLELAEAGFAEDVDVAVEMDAGSAVPVLSGGAFRTVEPT